MRISCLMVSLPVPARFEGMMRAIGDWRRQTHSDRELIVVLDPPGSAAQARAAAAVGAIADPDIRLVVPETRLSLGHLRNLAVEAASGELVCQWDDDDYHHPDRIAAQCAAIAAADQPAGLLQDVMMFDAGARHLRWTNWAATPIRGHPGTLICRRALMPLYPDAALGEDQIVAEALRDAGLLYLQPDEPHLYVYVTHGVNSTSTEHRAMLSAELSISSGLLRRREAVVRAGMAPFDFGTGAVVMGANGPAFDL